MEFCLLSLSLSHTQEILLFVAKWKNCRGHYIKCNKPDTERQAQRGFFPPQTKIDLKGDY